MWKGYPEEFQTWLSEKEIRHQAPKLLRRFLDADLGKKNERKPSVSFRFVITR